MNENFDYQEIAQFERMADQWWDKEGPCRPLHDLNPTRLQFIADQCSLPTKKVLDIGCGGGILTESLTKRGAMVTGIDATQTLIEIANTHALNANLSIHYIHTTAEVLAETHPAAFDIITCLELLEHVPHPELLIRACAALIKPGGHLFFSTLNRTPKAYAMAILGAEYLLKLLPKNTHHYEKFIRPSELDSALRAENLNLMNITGLKYNPFTRQCSLIQDPSVNYLVHVQRDP
jgi:2-polyprenyl-6-hydroxyphenyl methylase/3-demethylubiquinone-9 3-methyltransferase